MTAVDPNTRGHRGLIAVAIVIASALALWLATVALVRSSARGRITDEITRLRAAGEPLTLAEACGPTPAAADDAFALLLPIAARLDDVGGLGARQTRWLPGCASDPEFARRLATAAEGSRLDVEQYVTQLLDLDETFPAVVDDVCAAQLFAAWARDAEDEIAICRAAADRPQSSFSARDMKHTLLHLTVGRLLGRSAIAAALAGDGAAARADLERVLAMRAHLDRVPLLITHALQCALVLQLRDTLEYLLAQSAPPRELRALDDALAAIDVERDAARALRGERAHFIELFASSAPPWSVSPTVFTRVIPVQLGTWPTAELRVAESLDLWRESEAFVGRPLHAVYAEPAFRAHAAKLEQPGDLLSGTHVPTVYERAAGQRMHIALMRAALRARFDGFAAASAFLATELDPFTGVPIYSRVEPDGSWVAWCSSRLKSPANVAGPTLGVDRIWRLRK